MPVKIAEKLPVEIVVQYKEHELVFTIFDTLCT